MIRLEGLNIAYGDKEIITDFNAKFESKKLNFLTGPSGCGKTSILNAIGLINDNYRGKIFVNDCELKKVTNKIRVNKFRYEIGFLFQNFGLIENQTIEDNLLIALKYQKLTKKEKRNKIIETLCYLNIDLDPKQKIYCLSGGQQQRIAIARLLLKECQIILADEPTGSLDMDNSLIVMDELRNLAKLGKTIIVVTHDLELIKAEDRCISLT